MTILQERTLIAEVQSPHTLTRMERRWICDRCYATWGRKPTRKTCPGVPILERIPNELADCQKLLYLHRLPSLQTTPIACVIDGNSYRWLYRPEDCLFQRRSPPIEYCYQTTLKRVFRLTDTWIEALGPPDQSFINRYNTEVHLYDLNQVRDFLWQRRWGYFDLFRYRNTPVPGFALLPPVINFALSTQPDASERLMEMRAAIVGLPPMNLMFMQQCMAYHDPGIQLLISYAYLHLSCIRTQLMAYGFLSEATTQSPDLLNQIDQLIYPSAQERTRRHQLSNQPIPKS